MFQSFDTTANPDLAKERVFKLRQEMEKLGLDGFLVPRADEHQGEYIPPNAQRLPWLTGFTGSAGVALILKESAHIFVDGRYHLQVKQQTDAKVFQYQDLISCPPSLWVEENAKGLILGFDPWLHTIAGVKALQHNLETKANGKLIAVEKNLVDIIWEDQPEPPITNVSIQPLQYAGQDANSKLQKIMQNIAKNNADIAVLTDPSSIAWALNIRGQDISNTPFALSFALIQAKERPLLFIDPRKLGDEVKKYLQHFIDIFSPQEFLPKIIEAANLNKNFMLDPFLVAKKIMTTIVENGGKTIEKSDPVSLLRACKNQTELQGARDAQARDGVALSKFFAWLSRQEIGSIDEIKAAQMLESLRLSTAEQMGSKLLDLSFDTISGAGPNSAVIHYRVTKPTNRILNAGELYLVDSGGQYRDGTTDVTRTVAIGNVGNEEKRCFTLVLKGMINLSLARFPTHTRGQDIDALARINLWKAGMDFAHGTGHGIGAYLSVHEGPQNISKRGSQELLPGMIISNEPGYYRDGYFGIRIENLLIVEEASKIAGGDIAMHSFETLTLCPIDRNLIVKNMLNEEELHWLNDYHQRVYEHHATYLDDEDKIWLEQATQPL